MATVEEQSGGHRKGRSREKENLQHQFERVLETVDTGLFVLDGDLTVLLMNGPAARITGREESSCRGKPIDAVFGEEFSSIQWLFPAVMRTGLDRRTSFSLCRTQNDLRYLNITVALLSEPEEEVRLLVCLNDTTEQYQDMVKTAQTEKMAAVGLLAAGIAHEFNNIWASVQGYAELAKQSEEFRGELVDVAIEQSERAAEIIHSLLSFSDLRVELHPGIRLGRILHAITKLVDLELRAKGIQCSLEIRQDPMIVGNESMMQQVFLNLVINAYQAIDGTGQIHVVLSEEEKHAVVRVRDTGKGIEPGAVSRLFEPFYTTKGAFGGNEEVDGHGLGLTLTYNLIRMHHGDITVESKPGEGSVFTVRIPLPSGTMAEQSEKILDAAGARVDDVLPPNTVRVLVVEDEVVLHGLIRGILNDQTVDTVRTGPDAIAALEENAYDIVLLDLVLETDMDGFEVFEHIAKTHPAVKVVLLTGRPRDNDLSAIATRSDGLLTKPFSVEDLRSALARVRPNSG